MEISTQKSIKKEWKRPKIEELDICDSTKAKSDMSMEKCTPMGMVDGPGNVSSC